MLSCRKNDPKARRRVLETGVFTQRNFLLQWSKGFRTAFHRSFCRQGSNFESVGDR
ncbi:UNVERIFIED_CONTAM: hypothetical protein GTU68_018290, partial [Idotea baltica]|nr:hypothetical protein [Idotea baltica]